MQYLFNIDGNSRFDKKRLIENRQILIFLSSTFSDMEDERSALVKTFNRLKISAARRNVDLSLIDLRWGVNDEEARTGKVISVCLNEIEHSHPFFIGLLGNRYGRAPKTSVFTKNPELLERYPWLEADVAAERSITEIEMLYGALRHLEHPVEAAFYIKQTSEPDDSPKQTALKETVRSQKHYPVENYTIVKDLCTLVEHHLYSMLDKYFPDGECTPIERERTAQRAYINSRHSHFVGREKELEVLDTFARSTKSHLVITGDSGIGKSALLANWIRNNENSGDFNLVYHFVGNSFAGNNYESVLRHLCDEIYDIYHIEKDTNRQEKPEEEAQRLVSELASRKKPLVVIIDGINQIMAPKDEKLLLWLPAANNMVKFIFTTLRDDPTMLAFERRGYEVRTLEALTDEERKHFTKIYLKRVGKSLDEEPLRRIIDDPENHNTLVLRTLLDELICFGSYDYLNDRIDYYLSANGIPDFFDRVLKRMEDDYNNGQDLVSHTLRLIALSEHGMNEEELLAITGFRQMDWHLFYCAFFNHFVVKGGLITFSHQYVADAVARRYAIGDSKTNVRYCQEIAKHFASMSPDDEIQRQRCISELAHQYYHLEEWPNLHKVILGFEAFDYLYSTNKLLLAKYWRELISIDNKQYGLLDYLQIPLTLEEATMSKFFNSVGSFMSKYFAEYYNALKYYFKALAIREKAFGTNHPDTATSYQFIGMVYWKLGDYDKATEYEFKALSIREKVLDLNHPSISLSYNDLGILYSGIGDYSKSLEYHLKALALREKVFGKEHPSTALSYNNIGLVYMNQGKYNKALDYYLKSLAVREMVFGTEHPSTATLYNNIGMLYKKHGSYDKALEFLFKALMTREKLLGKEHPDTATSYNNIAVTYREQDDYENALYYHLQALAIVEKILGKNHPIAAISYNNIGLLFKEKGDYKEALEYYLKALEIEKKVLGTEHPTTATTYNNIGAVYDDKGDYDKALGCHFNALTIREKHLGEYHPNTAQSFNNIGSVYANLRDYNNAIKYYLKALAIWEKVLGTEHSSTATSYNNIAVVYDAQGNYVKALEYYQKALEIREKVLGEEHSDTAGSYNNIGLVYKKQGDYVKALEYLRKALTIVKKVLGTKHPFTASSYNNIGMVFKEQGDYDKALEYYQKVLEIDEEVLGTEHPDTATLYNNIGGVYRKQGDYKTALDYYTKAYRIRKKKLGKDHPKTKDVLASIDIVKKAMNFSKNK